MRSCSWGVLLKLLKVKENRDTEVETLFDEALVNLEKCVFKTVVEEMTMYVSISKPSGVGCSGCKDTATKKKKNVARQI